MNSKHESKKIEKEEEENINIILQSFLSLTPIFIQSALVIDSSRISKAKSSIEIYYYISLYLSVSLSI